MASTAEINKNIETVTSTAAMIPVIGNIAAIVGKVAQALGLKGKTTHLSWNEADALARPFADNMTNTLQSKFGLDDHSTTLLWTALQSRMTAFIAGDAQGSTWWTPETRKLYWNAYVYEVEKPSARDSLWYCFWLYSHWVYENVDGTKIDSEGSDKLNYIASQVVIPSLLDVGLVSNTTDVKVTGGKITSPDTAKLNGFQFNMASLAAGDTLMYILGGVLVIFLVIQATKRGG